MTAQTHGDSPALPCPAARDQLELLSPSLGTAKLSTKPSLGLGAAPVTQQQNGFGSSLIPSPRQEKTAFPKNEHCCELQFSLQTALQDVASPDPQCKD